MKQSYRALLWAQFLIGFITLEATGLTRVDHHGYHAVNNTYDPKQWNQQQQTYGQPNGVTASNTLQRWPIGTNTNVNPTAGNNWNRYNQTGYGRYKGYQNPSNANQWQRKNYTVSHTGIYNPGLSGWNQQQQQQHNQHQHQHHLSNSTTAGNWQRTSGQSHLYPQLPQSNSSWAIGNSRQQPTAPTTPNYHLNGWNNTNNYGGQWQNYPGNAGNIPNQNNWMIGQNRTSWSGGGGVTPTVQPGTNGIYSKGISSNIPNSYSQNQTGTYGWNGSPTAGGQNNWSNWKNIPSSPNGNNWPNNNGVQNSYSNNWPNSQGSQGNSGNQGTPSNLANSVNSGNSGGTPLAPISQSSGLPLVPLGASSSSNLWNNAGNTGTQLVPLAPLSYGSGNNQYDPSKKGNNQYGAIFN